VIINGHFAFFCLKNGKTAGKRLPKARQSDNINLYMQKNCRENRRFSMKKQSNLSSLMGYAGGYRILTYLSWILSVMSALLALVPFWYIWRIIHDILEVSPDFSRAEKVTSYGWSAVLFAVISIVVTYCPSSA